MPPNACTNIFFVSAIFSTNCISPPVKHANSLRSKHVRNDRQFRLINVTNVRTYSPMQNCVLDIQMYSHETYFWSAGPSERSMMLVNMSVHAASAKAVQFESSRGCRTSDGMHWCRTRHWCTFRSDAASVLRKCAWGREVVTQWQMRQTCIEIFTISCAVLRKNIVLPLVILVSNFRSTSEITPSTKMRSTKTVSSMLKMHFAVELENSLGLMGLRVIGAVPNTDNM